MNLKDDVEKWAKEHNLEEKINGLLPVIESFDKRNELFTILNNDVKSANNAASLQINDQYLRRTVVRTSFAMIEGLLNILNQTVLDIYKAGFTQLDTEELENLMEETQSKKGVSRPKFMSLNNKVLFSFRIFAKKLGNFDYSIDTTTDEWKEFENAVLIRNHLMHPRNLEDMILNEDQMLSILKTWSWFTATYGDLERQVGDISAKRSLENLIKARIKGIQAGKK